MKEFEECLYDLAWKELDKTQQVVNVLDTKAMGIINFSSILIPIITGIIFYIKKQQMDIFVSIGNYDVPFNYFLFGSIILLIITILFAFAVIWPRDYGIIPTNNHFDKIYDFIENEEEQENNYALVLMGKSAQNIADWQTKILDAIKNKSEYFKICSYLFVSALFLIFFSALAMFKI